MAEQGRGGGRALLFSQYRRPALNHNPAADRRSYGHVAMVSELLRGVRLFLDFVYCVTGPRARELL